MRNFALFLVLLTLIGFTQAFLQSFKPTAVHRLQSFAEKKEQNRVNNVEKNQISFFGSSSKNSMSLRAIETSDTEIDMLADIEYTKGMPDKPTFGKFYRDNVSFGMEMTLEKFVNYSSVKDLLADGLIMTEDVTDLWQSAVGDATGLNEGESYELLCMVLDLPDPEVLT
jgi:hypothetical protein